MNPGDGSGWDEPQLDIVSVARLHGGNIVQPPTDMFWGDRTAIIIDPEGHKWMVATHVKDIPFDQMEMPS